MYGVGQDPFNALDNRHNNMHEEDNLIYRANEKAEIYVHMDRIHGV